MFILISGKNLDLYHPIVDDLANLGLTPISLQKVIVDEGEENEIVFELDSGLEYYPILENEEDTDRIVGMVKAIAESSNLTLALVSEEYFAKFAQIHVIKDSETLRVYVVLHEGIKFEGTGNSESEGDTSESSGDSDEQKDIVRISGNLSLVIDNRGDSALTLKQINESPVGFYLEDWRGTELVYIIGNELKEPKAIEIGPKTLYEDNSNFTLRLSPGIYRLVPVSAWFLYHNPESGEEERMQYTFPAMKIEVF